MRVLHKILVCISSAQFRYGSKSVVEAIKNYATEETEEYRGKVFEWRTVPSKAYLGEFGSDVIFASDDLDSFLEEIKEAETAVNEKKDFLFKKILSVSNDLSELLTVIQEEGICSQSLRLESYLELCRGKYRSDSLFYDTGSGSSRITEDTYNKIRDKPRDYALVLLDYHY